MKKAVLYTVISMCFAGSTWGAESWYSPYLQKIRSYFNPATLGYGSIAATGGYVAHRANWNPCIGAACGLLLGLSAEKLSNLYANASKPEPKEPESYQTITPKKVNPQYAQPTQMPTQTSTTPATQLALQNPQKFHSDYQTIKDAVFARFNSSEFENDFNTKYRQPTVDAVIALASHFDAIPRWSETLPLSATISIDGERIPLTGDIANIIYDNQDAIIKLRQSYQE